MSRLIIKGLPGRYDDKQLRDLFSPIGEVTDARVMKTQDGRSRRFGFVGFRTKQDAARARTAMHRAFVDTSAVHVEVAHVVGDESIPRPWSRYSTGSSRFMKENPDLVAEEQSRFPNGIKPTRGLRDSSDAERTAAAEVPATGDKAAKKADKEFAAFEEVVAPLRAGRAGIKSTKQANAKSELVKSRRNGTKGDIVERKHVTFQLDESDNDDDEKDDLYEDLPKIDQSKELTDTAKTGEELPEAGDETALNTEVSDMDYFKSKVVSTDNGNESADDSSAEDNDSSAEDNDSEDKEAVGVNKRNPIEGEQDDDSKADSEADSEADSATNGDATMTGENNGPAKRSAPEVKVAKPSETVDAGETGRLMVRNLAYSVTEEELESSFEQYGALAEVHIVRDSSSGRSRGLGFVQFSVAEEAAKAMVALDRSFNCGRIMHVLAAQPRPMSERARAAIGRQQAGSSAFKTTRADARTDAARSGADATAQHALHVSADAAAEVAAERHGVSKAELLGAGRGESGMAAVRVAVAEAAVQAEARAHMMLHGVDLEAAERAAAQGRAEGTALQMGRQKKRMSRTALLVKGLPARTKDYELQNVFGKFGKIARLVVVPSGLLAVVQFATASTAKLAYNGLAYTRFKDTPLYLQWLPEEALLTSGGEGEVGEGKTEEGNGELSSTRKQADERKREGEQRDGAEGEREEGIAGCSVYVKNLSFETRDEELKRHFEAVLKKRPKVAASLRSVKVALKRGPEGKEGAKLSMGFGFLEFGSREDAIEAVKIGQNSRLGGHMLLLQLSQRAEAATGDGKKRKRRTAVRGKPGSKVVVRNIAFEATRRDVRALFAAFGQLKTVRMPRKMDGTHRGFAFVEFVSRNEAMAAVDALSETHLYGRHVVIEYAQEGDCEDGVGMAGASLEELQEKAAKQVASLKKRRLVGGDGGGGGGGGGGDRDDDASGEGMEKDDVAMMRDELYG